MQRRRVQNTVAVGAAVAAVALPAALGAWPAGVTPGAPPNFAVEPYARGLSAPQALLVLPNGDVLVSERAVSRSRVTLLRDANHDGRAAQQFVLIDAEQTLQGLALRRDRLYVARGDGILSCPFLVGQTRLHGRCRQLSAGAAGQESDLWRHCLQLSRDEAGLYLSAGREASGAGSTEESPPAQPVELVRPETGATRELGSVRGSPLALAVEPESGQLWVAVGAPRRLQGEAAPDFLAPLGPGATAKRGTITLEPQAAPRGLTFYQRQQFPRLYRGGAFVALHGDAADASASGAKVVYLPFENGRPAGGLRDFLTGFAGEGADRSALGRPAALAVATDGSLLVADDLGNTVWRVSFRCGACTPDPAPAPRSRPR